MDSFICNKPVKLSTSSIRHSVLSLREDFHKRNMCLTAILIPEDAIQFFREAFGEFFEEAITVNDKKLCEGEPLKIIGYLLGTTVFTHSGITTLTIQGTSQSFANSLTIY